MKIDESLFNLIAGKVKEVEESLSKISPGTSQFYNLVKKHARLKRIEDKINLLKKLRDELAGNEFILSDTNSEEELKILAQSEIEKLKNKIIVVEKDIMFELLPHDPNDERNIIVEIRAGAGGDEAALFAGDLARMYMRYAESRGWKVEVMDSNPSDIGGYKEIIFSIQGENVYRFLRFEGGTHRVQRVPITEASGRIHTSTVTVAILPEAEDVDEIEIRPEDLKIDVYRASGAGGQHVNKTDSAVRITHLPTGIVVSSQEERSQHKNKAKAMRILKSRLLAIKQAEATKAIDNSRRLQVGTGERSERIRTYNFPQNRLTDHRINFTVYNLPKIMDGELDELINALQEYDMAEKMKKIADFEKDLSSSL